MKNKTNYNENEIKLIGERIREQRLFDGLSQRELADQINVEKNVIQRIESGKLKTIKLKTIREIAYALQRNPEYFLLTSDSPRHANFRAPLHYSMPEFQHSVEAYIYNHSKLRSDIEYISKYMHPEMQRQILNLIHTFVTFHKCGVHYPDTTAEKSSQIDYKNFDKQIKENFFASVERKNR